VFRIVGAKPAAQVLALGELSGVEVTGAVPDVRPFVAQAAVIVAPLRIARGIQNKVLEGMAAGRPMVATPEALDGIDAEIGRDVLVGADAGSFAAAVVDVLLGRAPPALGADGRRYVVAHHQWSAQLQVLDRIMSGLAHEASGQVPA
jgi:glycosyltransferase involved in cell wall biosynthesis